MTAALILATLRQPNVGLFDPTENIGQISAIRRQIETFRQAGIEKVVVSVGDDADKIEAHCSRQRVVFVRYKNTIAKNGNDGLRAGLEYLKFKCTQAFISPSCYPLFSCDTVSAMMGYQSAVVSPECGGRTGYPILISGKMFDHASAFDLDPLEDFPDFLQAGGAARFSVAVRDRGISTDVRSADKKLIDSIVAEHPLRRLRPDIKISLSRENSFFGPGALHLLNLTEEVESLMQASKIMGLSYSKARKLIAKMEEQLEYRVIESHHGGRTGGYSVLTPRARMLMKKYRALQEEGQEKIEELFVKYFGGDI